MKAILALYGICLVSFAQLSGGLMFPGPGRAPSGTSPFGPNNLLVSITPGTPRNDFTGLTGMKFTATASFTPAQLGAVCLSGNTGNKVVGIYAVDTSPFGTATIDMTGCTPGSFVYAAYSGLGITSGMDYYLAGVTVDTGNTWWNSTPVTINPSWGDDPISVYSSPGFVESIPNESFFGVDLVAP